LGGRLVLLKAVLSSLPVYFLSFFKAPAGIISSIESIFKRFFWGGGEGNRKIAWINWDTICLPKAEGGLGVRRMGAFNISLLGKWCWRMLTDREGLWYRVLKARYGEEGGRIKEGGRLSSAWWKMVCQIREGIGVGVGNWFESNVSKVVGDGRNTLFWYDKWCGDISLRMKFPRLFDLAVEKESTVRDMERCGWGFGGRAWVWRRRLFAWEEESVRECSLLLHNISLQDTIIDKWRWSLDPIHGYTVKGAYTFLTSNGVMVDRSNVDDVWHKHIPSKVSLLVWRLLRNRIPTKDNLEHQGVLSFADTSCVYGCASSESAEHLFLHCTMANKMWALVCKWLGISFVLAGELRNHYIQFTKMAGMPLFTRLYFNIIWFATVWVIWKDRNHRVFQNTISDPTNLIELVKCNSYLWLRSKQVAFGYSYHDWWKHPIPCMGVLL
jgi:hypothetical protein